MKFFILTLILLMAGSLSSQAYSQPANDNACGAITLPVENLGCEPTTIYSYTVATWTSGSGKIPTAMGIKILMFGTSLLYRPMERCRYNLPLPLSILICRPSFTAVTVAQR